VSCDTVFSHKAFAEKLGGISYPLLADFWPHGKISQAYDAFNEESGRSRRVLYLIDGEGVIRFTEFYSSGVPDNEKVLAELDKLK
jgi:alkyl hydroperoxide reductase subunit AhpC